MDLAQRTRHLPFFAVLSLALAALGSAPAQDHAPVDDAAALLAAHAPQWGGHWVWYPEEGADFVQRYFRRAFALESADAIASAYLQITADDACTVYINGEHLGGNGTWAVPRTFEVTKLLRSGANVIAVACEENDYAEGLLAELTLNGRDGGVQRTVTDAQWLAAKSVEGDRWTAADFDATGWRPAAVVAKAGEGAWGRIAYRNLAHKPEAQVTGVDVEPAQVAPGDTAHVTVQLATARPLDRDYHFFARLVSQPSAGDPKADWGLGEAVVGEVQAATATWTPGQPQRVTFALPVPDYAPRGTVPVELVAYADGVEMVLKPGEQAVALAIERPLPSVEPIEQAAIIDHRGAPAVRINDTAEFPALWYTGQKHYLPYSRYSETGVRLWRVSAWPLPMVTAPEEADRIHDQVFTNIERAMHALLGVNPDAAVMVAFYMEPSAAWQKVHADQMLLRADGERGLRSMASQPWREQGVEALRKLVGRLEAQPFADRIFCYTLQAGRTSEFIDWAYAQNADAWPQDYTIGDFSEPMVTYLRDYLRRRYDNDVAKLRQAWGDPAVTFETARVDPAIAVTRGAVAYRRGTSLRPLVDLQLAMSDANAAALIDFAEAIKDATGGRKLVGAYYGYLLQFSNPPGAIGQSGHLALGEVLDSPAVDVLFSPYDYDARNAGTAAAPFAPLASIEAAGKLWLTELDTRTYRADPAGGYMTRTPRETIAIMRRNVGRQLADGSGFWWYDMSRLGQRFWFDAPELIAAATELYQACRRSMDHDRHSTADVAYVVSERAPAYMTPQAGGVRHGLVHAMRQQLDRTGVAYDMWRLEDLLASDRIDQYRLVILADALMLSTQDRQRIRERWQADGRWLLWCMAPGVYDEAGWQGKSGIRDVTGFDVYAIKTIQRSGIITADAAGRVPGLVAGERFSAPSFGPTVVDRQFPPEVGPGYAIALDAETPALAVDGAQNPLLAARESESHTDVLLTGCYLSADVLRSLARAAGCHVWIANDALVTHVNRGWLTLHAAEPVEVTVRLPGPSRVQPIDGEAFDAEGAFTVQLEEVDSRVYHIQPSAASQ